MKICPKCGEIHAEALKFCTKCGIELAPYKPEPKPEAEKAIEVKEPVTEKTGFESPRPREISPGRYIALVLFILLLAGIVLIPIRMNEAITRRTKTTTTLPQSHPVAKTTTTIDEECPNGLDSILVFRGSDVAAAPKCLEMKNSEFSSWKIDKPSIYSSCILGKKDNYAPCFCCDKGSKTGENVNYYYCKIYNVRKTFTDARGNIIKNVKKDVTLVYDSNGKFIRIICE